MPNITGIAGVRNLRRHAHSFAISFFAEEDRPHPTPLTLLVPVHPKDASRLAVSLVALKQRLAHPIERIVIVSPADDELKRLAERLGAEIYDETAILPEAVLKTSFITNKGRNRNGWLRQQFIKLCWPDWLDAERVLAFDADTKLARRLRFMNDLNQSILYTADDYSQGFFAMAQRALGPIRRAPWSFVAHNMLFERPSLLRMQDMIGQRLGGPWLESLIGKIDPSEPHCFSEFELYGNYMYNFEPQHIALRYFRNKKIPESLFHQQEIPPLLRRFRTLSSHNKHRTIAKP